MNYRKAEGDDENKRHEVQRELSYDSVYVHRLMRGVQKIRWYHWSVYYLYRWMWDPILIGRPGMVRCMRDEFTKWLEVQERAERREGE